MLEDPSHEKQEAFDAARDLLSRNDDSLLRYVALELRRCMEAVVYEKLWGYRDWIPIDAARSWQPPQAFKALLAVEPEADKSRTIAVAMQKDPGVPSPGPYQNLGVDHRPGYAWLEKTYHKLGSFLHARWPFAKSKNRSGMRQDFQRILTELEPFVSRTLTVSIAMLVEFPCSYCGSVVKVSERGVKSNKEATCLKCSCRFSAQEEATGFTFHLDEPSQECETCHEQIFVPEREMKIGGRFSCRKCSTKYEVMETTWGVRRVAEKVEENKESQTTE
jgi:hypothetical protein